MTPEYAREAVVVRAKKQNVEFEVKAVNEILDATRSSLIRKGMAYSPAHGDIAFTVPLFDGFMKRIMRLEE